MSAKENSIQMRLDALREVGMIGAGSASSAFSEMLDSKINLDVPWVRLTRISLAAEMLAPPKGLLVEVHTRITGDINAVMVVLFEREDAKNLANMVLENVVVRDDTEVLDSFGRDALKEVSNILIGSYTTALNKFLGIRLRHHVPMISFTLTERSITDITRGFEDNVQHALIIATEFLVSGSTISGKTMLLMDSASLNLLMDMLDEKLGV